MIAISRFATEDPQFAERAEQVLRLLEARPGFVSGRAARALDAPTSWVLVTEWVDVGSYRRGMGAYDVKVGAWPLLAEALAEPSAFEVLVTAPVPQQRD